jgi:hypothetical protein
VRHALQMPAAIDDKPDAGRIHRRVYDIDESANVLW